MGRCPVPSAPEFGVTHRLPISVWQFVVGLIVGIGLGILIMAALVASRRKH
jgi:hypothetical protein